MCLFETNNPVSASTPPVTKVKCGKNNELYRFPCKCVCFHFLTTAFVYHSGPSSAGSRGTGQPFVPLLLHPVLNVLQTLLEGLLLGSFFRHGSRSLFKVGSRREADQQRSMTMTRGRRRTKILKISTLADTTVNVSPTLSCTCDVTNEKNLPACVYSQMS